MDGVDILPKQFFDLESFAHRDLFAIDQPVWATLSALEEYLHTLPLGKILGEVSPQAYLVYPELIFVDKECVVEPGAYIQGPCWLGPGTQVRHGAYVRGNCLTGEHAVIGHATEVKNAIFLNDAKAGHFAYIGDSILGNRVNLGAGTKCANLRFDGECVPVCCGGEKVQSDRRKFGAIFGDDAQTGCNSVTNPGTIVHPGGWVRPCRAVSGEIQVPKRRSSS